MVLWSVGGVKRTGEVTSVMLGGGSLCVCVCVCVCLSVCLSVAMASESKGA